MQAMLSSTASGKQFRTSATTAPLPVAPCTIFSALASIGSDDGSKAVLDGLPSSFLTSSLSSSPQEGPAECGSLAHRASIAEGVGLAHDAGNLLGALGLYCELLALPGVLRNEHRHYAEELQLLSGRSRQLIDRLLNPKTTGRVTDQAVDPLVSKAGPGRSGRMIGEPAPATDCRPRAAELVVVPDVIEQCRGMLGAVARRAVEVAYDAGAATMPVAMPREALERILVNLTKNAAEASRTSSGEGGTITLRVTCLRARAMEDAAGGASGVHDRIVLSVEDKGCGMSTAAVKVLLGDGGMERRGPRGIGFQVVRELVGASGGELRLRSRSSDDALNGDALHADGADEASGAAGTCGSSGTTVEITWAVAAEVCAPVEKRRAGGVVRESLNDRQWMVVRRDANAGRVSC